MDGYSISEVAERTGFPATTLRFYEQSGLVEPARTPAGYRRYDDQHLELLGFIGRAKGFGLSLDEITDLLPLLDGERCAPLQGRLREPVDTKIADARQQIGDLTQFAAELRRASSSLTGHTPDGPCDDGCGCTTADDPNLAAGVARAAGSGDSADRPIVCTLGPDLVGTRIADWRAMLARVTSREAIEGGIRARFADGVDVSALAELAAAEQDCCRHFTFGLTIDPDGVALDITGPSETQSVIEALVGAST
jgi:DNA-binding transcriptional MerR regulator